MGMVLSAILTLDAGAFTTPLGRATEGLKTMIRISGDLKNRLEGAFHIGSELSDMQAQFNESAGKLMVLRQAFQDTGVGADRLVVTLAQMQKNIGMIDDKGNPTVKIFEQMGIKISDLKRMSATEQLSTIGAGISNLGTAAEQSAAAMQIFGRSGISLMTFLKDSGKFEIAERSLGSLPDLMTRNAAAFDAIDDAMKRLRNKTQGLWSGMAEGLMPQINQIVTEIDGIDLTKLGQKIGLAGGTLITMFKDNDLGEIVSLTLQIGLDEGVNYGVTAFVRLGDALMRAMAGPLATLSAEFGSLIQGAMEKLGSLSGWFDKHPIARGAVKSGSAFSPFLMGLNMADMAGSSDALKGFKSTGFWEQRSQSLDEIMKKINALKSGTPAGKIQLIDTSATRQALDDMYMAAENKQKDLIKKMQDAANDAGVSTAGKGVLSSIADKSDKSASGTSVLADRLTRIGGYMGSLTGRKMESLAERTARATERIAQRLSADFSPPVAVWAR